MSRIDEIRNNCGRAIEQHLPLGQVVSVVDMICLFTHIDSLEQKITESMDIEKRLAVENSHLLYTVQSKEQVILEVEQKLAKAKSALETYAITNETFPEYGDVARTTLAEIGGNDE